MYCVNAVHDSTDRGSLGLDGAQIEAVNLGVVLFCNNLNSAAGR